ncbi:MAG: HPr family phosphocarrier protein [Chthoniobacterales bacterium]|nr:HPr family phosphocarrier protein [Chthoniobacterales bacterium]
MKKHRSSGETIRASREITILNPLGLHARPAAEFVRRANSFRSEIWLVTKAGRFSALSLIDVMRANLDRGATAMLEASGIDAEAAVERLARLVRELRDL